ncbi:AAA family ATPase [Paracoccus sp. CPCC 101403]|uniref:AAA family ATPase n=1 Tax=Paracoccus broussonetiae TaxID=3075834 RepID=A0ABU3EJD5_9RHOB|nr:AAA family ATPase [Paracoccus sp. CPCC 101403]MDT1064367.1 AAA family ATPase [Paracoccus sp. CPCC 101403]
MIIRSLEVSNFRKFRDPLRVDGFTDGLNIVVEPNETGKSTLLEALRAAFFIRYSAKTELVRSYVPIGDDVAPRVSVGFDLKGQQWTLDKQFIKAPSVRLVGPSGRRESEAAEEALQELLGFERGNNRGTDPETRGPLGMLWVEQTKALEVESPNRIVRDSVRGVLEAEVGAVTGGRRFDAIRASVDAAYAALRTLTTGKSRGELAASEARVAAANTACHEAEGAFRDYEQLLSDLDNAKARLRIVERDLLDPETVEERRELEADVKLAETASLRSSAAEAQHGRSDELAKAAAARIERLDEAEARVEKADEEIVASQSKKADAQAAVNEASVDERARRSSLEAARKVREDAEAALTAARDRARDFAAAAGARRAVDARRALGELEERERMLAGDVALALDRKALDEIAQLEREEMAALARFEAGIVRVDLKTAYGTQLRINGVVSEVESIDVLTPTRFEIGDAGSITVHPPQATGRSMEVDLSAARARLATGLRSLDILSHAAGVARNERAASAERELKALRSQIAVACPGDLAINLAPGADALRAFVAGLGGNLAEAVAPADDLPVIEAEVSEARLKEVSAAATHEDSRAVLSKAENLLATAAANLMSATRELDTAAENLRTVLGNGDRATLQAALHEAQRDRAAKLEALEQAREGASAFDLAAIRRRMENIDRAASRAGEERLELTRMIATLEATIAREGQSGPAGRLAEAREEEVAATAACDRLRLEADTLETLRKALTDAANEASRTFLAPVTRRAARYVGRLLPGCDLSFDDGLSLAGVTRAGIDENCVDLSRGTQEQLAILTRLAFADLLLEDGAPISLILDDPLVYSDDARLETMTDILQEASQRMQVILLTCRSKAFRHVDGNRITLP